MYNVATKEGTCMQTWKDQLCKLSELDFAQNYYSCLLLHQD